MSPKTRRTVWPKGREPLVICIRVFRMFDQVTCTVNVEATHSNGWPQVPQAPFPLAYLMEEEEGQWERPADMLPMISQALEASDKHFGTLHGGMYDAVG